MKPLWITFIVGFFILFSFQNCQNPPHMDEINSLSTNSQMTTGDSSKVSLASERLREIQLYMQVSEQSVRNGKTFSMVGQQIYSFQFENNGLSNSFSVKSESTGVSQFYCLSESLKNELQLILNSASVCKAEDSNQPDQVCAAVMKPGYGQIITESNQYDLGAATDSCGNNSVDLCDSEGDLLKGFTQHLSSQLANLVCE
ncbi:MAG: hypothetical protein A2622_03490 [Bdellovibrionales bacterium RIFCSPHIGHO2_01_FULL_40_29]|nr:MAG: hypothetical protein A2622_03490 [Bdellovibrionales bacterium RIFCSPHIGHO2_01_FULL_40_29]OFZ35415.1 MAG: hypothetical protein A3D17_08540 [Bdellovibrionales bacterium RIFCSPHIGHO2_02_FULL_40_15]